MASNLRSQAKSRSGKSGGNLRKSAKRRSTGPKPIDPELEGAPKKPPVQAPQQFGPPPPAPMPNIPYIKTFSQVPALRKEGIE